MPLDPSRRTALTGALGGLAGALAAAVLPGRRAHAFGPPTRVDVAEIVLASGTLSRPEAWQRLLFEVIQTTSVESNPVAVQLSPEDPALFEHPFSVLIGDGALPDISDRAVEQLRRYLSYGGFLVLDDASGEWYYVHTCTGEVRAHRAAPSCN